ncbi:MAG: hypothetical protein PHE36_12185, partial [Novosphingobium sp.]|nr:hypothetical protein [Novosphingobium sp.]
AASRDLGLPGESAGAAMEAFAAGAWGPVADGPAPDCGAGPAAAPPIPATAVPASNVPALRHDGFTPARRVRFLDALAGSGNVRAACAVAGISAQAAYRARRRDGRFALAWEGALALARGHAEAVVADRALNGVDEPVFYHGEEVARRRRYDTRLLLAHLARLDAQCATPRAQRAAERFDELLAGIAGWDGCADGPDADELDEALACEEPARRGELAADGLGAGRAAYAEWRRRWAEQEALAEEEEAGEDGAEEDGTEEDWDATGGDPAAASGREAMRAAQAEWDARAASAWALVDELADGEEKPPLRFAGGDRGAVADAPASGCGALHHPQTPSSEVEGAFAREAPASIRPENPPVEFKGARGPWPGGWRNGAAKVAPWTLSLVSTSPAGPGMPGGRQGT